MGDTLSDEYVASLMQEESRERSMKYASQGFQAYLPQRSAGSAPKPNTRFLKSLLRDTTQHNAALLEKEQREARDRQRRSQQHRDGCLTPVDNSIGRQNHSSHNGTRRRERRSRSPRRERSRDRRRRWNSDGEDDERRGHRHHRRQRRSRSRSRERRHRRRHGSKERHRERHGRRRSSSSSSSSASPRPHRRRQQSDQDERDRSARKRSAPAASTASNRAEDSDPLEAIIGPLPPPPVRKRGRGAFNSSSMDAHFSNGYDPTEDVQLDSDTQDDWDQALEALRDRQKWHKQHADRLRAAGFTEDQIKTWEKGGNKDESDVRWAKKGEGREWDRGKVVNSDGDHVPQPEWGRLKGT